MKHMGGVLFLSLMLFFVTGCSGSPSKVLKKVPGEEVVHDSITIKPSRSYEECIELRPGMVVDYKFKSSNDVNFNIHYHSANDIHYPVSDEGVRRGQGMIDPAKHSFYTEEQEFYCLMWDNVTYEPVKVSFTCVLKGQHKKEMMNK